MDPGADQSHAGYSFEQALAALEAIVGELEQGQVDLAGSLARYEQGVRLLKHCHGLLGDAEKRIELLVKVHADGSPQTTNFEPETTAEPSAPRRERQARRNDAPARGRSAPPPGEIDAGDGLF